MEQNYGAVHPKGFGSFDIEDSPLQLQRENQIKSSNYSKYMFVMVASLAGLGIMAYYGKSFQNNIPALELKTAHVKLAWTLNRKGYDPLAYFTSDASEFLNYKFLQKYDAVVEPNAPMHLYVEDYSSKSEYYYSFTVCPSATDDEPLVDEKACKVGTLKSTGKKLDYKSATVDCEPFEKLDISITKYSDDDVAEYVYTGSAMCMYVRREIRDLSDEDLSATMDAMYALWSTSDEDGQQLYGADFHNITYLLEMHHFNAAWPDADHFHEGNGFLAQHIKMTNIFEGVMQLVDPSVSLPYWDFTIDTEDRLAPFESPVLTEEMFGSVRIPVGAEYDVGYTYANSTITDFAILNGRWAFTKAESNPDKFAGLEAGYGFMRSPWNMNPSPYVTRFSGTSQMPKCSTHFDMLEYTDLMDFMFMIEVNPHASVHGSNGGTFGCDLFDPLVNIGAIEDEDSKMQVCKLWIFSLKALYRKNLLFATQDCVVPDNVNDAVCPFSCGDGNEDAVKDLLFYNLVKTAVPKWLSTDQENAWLDFVCGGDGARVFAGDHAESASPSDPSFWPIHPTLERLFQAKMMAGGFATTDWATDPVDSVVCTHHECYIDNELGEWEQCCYGHYENDQMLDFEKGDTKAHWGPTNAATMKGADPTHSFYKMPYIYDKFTWDHCSSEPNGDLNAKLKNLYASSLDRRKK